MLKEQLKNLKVSLIDNIIIEDFEFNEDKIHATIGTTNSHISARILNLKINTPSSITLDGQDIEINWDDIQISVTKISTLRNGKPVVYEIK